LPEATVLRVRWYLRFSLSYRDVEELLAGRGIDVDHVTAVRIDVRAPRMNAIMERWVRTCRELLERTLIYNQAADAVCCCGGSTTTHRNLRTHVDSLPRHYEHA